MYFNSDKKQTFKYCLFYLCNIVKIRHILTQKDAEKVVHVFFTSRPDYFNSFLSGCSNRYLNSLQLIQKAPEWVLTGTRRDYISHVLDSLHWLSVKYIKEFEILHLTYKALNSQAPSYVKVLIVPYYSSRTWSSQNADLLVVPSVSKSRMGGRALGYQNPLLWNHLPVWVLEADTLSTLRVGL